VLTDPLLATCGRGPGLGVEVDAHCAQDIALSGRPHVATVEEGRARGATEGIELQLYDLAGSVSRLE